ncbi:MAG: YlxR family protein [Prochlorothrix sp.]
MPPNYRRCISCRKVAPKAEFWRVVRLAQDRSIQLDHGMGRSAYLCPNLDCLQAAQKKNRLGRALRAPIPADLYPKLSDRLS